MYRSSGLLTPNAAIAVLGEYAAFASRAPRRLTNATNDLEHSMSCTLKSPAQTAGDILALKEVGAPVVVAGNAIGQPHPIG